MSEFLSHKEIVPTKIFLICSEIPLQFMSDIFWHLENVRFTLIPISAYFFSLCFFHSRPIWGEWPQVCSPYQKA